MPYVRSANAIVGFGNELILSTWKQVFQGPIYPFNNYGSEGTEFVYSAKDFLRACLKSL